MGSPFSITLFAQDSAQAAQFAKTSFRLVDSLNAIFSDYLQDSELNRLSKTAGTDSFVSVSPQLYDVLVTSKKAAATTKGTFDITIGPLSRLWRTARSQKLFPTDTEVQKARQLTGMQLLIIDTINKKVKLLRQGMQLDLGGIAKGYVAQKVIEYLYKNGITSALGDTGGDLVCSQSPPGKEGWLIGINLPGSHTELIEETISISEGAVATSGDLYQYMEHNGKRYSHIIDPRIGYGVPFQRNVTVIAKDGATADWLATACSILPVNNCKKLARQFGADILITQWQKGKLRYFMTDGMKKRLGR